MPTTAATRAAREASFYNVTVTRKTATHVTARVSRKADKRRSYTVWLDTQGVIACQCEASRRNPTEPCKHAYVLLTHLENNQ